MLTHLPGWMILAAPVVADIGYDALVPTVMFTALAVVTVTLRLYCRIRLSKRDHGIGAEDLLVAASMVLSIGVTSIVGAEFHIDVKTNRPNKGGSLMETMMKLVYTQSIAYHTAINFVKISILLQYYKLFRGISGPIIGFCYLLFVLDFGTAGWGIGGVIFLCNPVRKYWRVRTSGTCINVAHHFWSTAMLGIVLDWAIWALPIPAIGRLNIGGRHKIWLLCMFGLGAFTCIASTIRLVIVHDAAEKGDITKSGTHALVWSTVELNTAIICASLLVMKPLFLRFFPSLVNDDQPTTARENASEFFRALTEIGLTGPAWVPWIWKRDVHRGLRMGEAMRQRLRDSSDSSSTSTIEQSLHLDGRQAQERWKERRGDSCVGNETLEIGMLEQALLAANARTSHITSTDNVDGSS